MYTYEYTTNGVEISAENQILMNNEITTKVGAFHEIIYNIDMITVIMINELNIPLQLELYAIVSRYIIYIDPQELKNQMCEYLNTLTTTELGLLKYGVDAVYYRSPQVTLKRDICNKYQVATDEELTMYQDVITDFNNGIVNGITGTGNTAGFYGIIGPQGVTGPQGLNGLQGVTGPQGQRKSTYILGTLDSNVIEAVFTGSSNGDSVVFSAISGGSPIFSSIIPASASINHYSTTTSSVFGTPVLSGDKTTITVPFKVLSTTGVVILGITVVGSVNMVNASNGTPVTLRILGYPY